MPRRAKSSSASEQTSPRTGSARVFCSFLRFLLDAHPRVLQQLLAAAPHGSAAPPERGAAPENAIAAAAARAHGSGGAALPRSSMNQYVATTVGVRAPSVYGANARDAQQRSAGAGHGGAAGCFIVEDDDARFMHRLLHGVLPDSFAVAPPLTAFQFFRSTGGFALAKARLVRNVAALFARREAQLRDAAEMRDALAEQRDVSRRYILAQNNCGAGDAITDTRYECGPLVDATNRTQLTARQRVAQAERDAAAAAQRQVDQAAARRRELNRLERRDAVPDHRALRDAPRQSPMVLPLRDDGVTTTAAATASLRIAATAAPTAGDAWCSDPPRGLAFDHALAARAPPAGEELVEERLTGPAPARRLVSPSRRSAGTVYL